MLTANELLNLNMDSEAAIAKTVASLSKAGLLSIQSFDLQAARTAPALCACPHHGTDLCDCQMVVLLIYAEQGYPATLVVHGHQGQTHISLVDTPAQRSAPELQQEILQALSELRESQLNQSSY